MYGLIQRGAALAVRSELAFIENEEHYLLGEPATILFRNPRLGFEECERRHRATWLGGGPNA